MSSCQSSTLLKLVLVAMVLVNLFVNFDSGTVGHSQSAIRAHFQVGNPFMGLVNSVPYFGLAFSTPVWTVLIERSPKPVFRVTLGLLLNVVGVVMMATTYYINPPWFAKLILLLGRLIIGFTQAGFIIYVQIWVDAFAPDKNQGTWQSLVQAGTVLGILLGYGVTDLFFRFRDTTQPSGYWSHALFVQVAFLIVLTLVLMFTPEKFTNYNIAYAERSSNATDQTQAETTTNELEEKQLKEMVEKKSSVENTENKDLAEVWPTKPQVLKSGSFIESFVSRPSFCVQMTGELLHNDGKKVRRTRVRESFRGILRSYKYFLRDPLWIIMTVQLCSLYFTVTGIQYYVTSYLQENFRPNRPEDPTAKFQIISATGPIIGVILGGFIVDFKFIGGFKSAAARFRTSIYSAVLATITTMIAIGSCFYTGPPTDTLYSLTLSSIFFILFFGGALVPAGVGLLLQVVEPEKRFASAGASMSVYNLFGFGLGSFLPSLFYGANNPDSAGRSNAGFPPLQFIFSISIIGALATYISVYIMKKHADDELDESAEVLDF